MLLLIIIACWAATSLAISPWTRPQGQKLYGSSFAVPGNATYDYVVVGGGLAGLTVAKRLSEDPSISIAVVEAGYFYEITNGNFSQIPYYATKFSTGNISDTQPSIDWEIVTEPETQLDNKIFRYSQGKCLGGSSARNQLIYHRGTIGSYQAWADQVGDQNYTWDNMLPYFKNSMVFTPPDTSKRASNASVVFNSSAYSLSGGPLHVSYPNYALPFSSWAAEACATSGLNASHDFASGILAGSGYNAVTVDPLDNTRSSSEASFLQEAIESSSLQVYLSTQALRILFDDSKTATGVNVSTSGESYVLTANKEVIISAGVFHSPQLLMVSGIGPAGTLRSHNITVISNLQGVGQGMRDSSHAGQVSFPINVISFAAINDPSYRAQATEEYLHNQTGLLTSQGLDFLAWEKLPEPYRSNLSQSTLSQLAQFPSDWPELEYLFSSTSTGHGAAGSQNYGTIAVALVAAMSRGNVTIKSSSMLDKPVLRTNWLLEKADQELAVQSVKRARDIWSHMSGVATGPESAPGTNVTSDEDILAFIRASMYPVHHSTCTCVMGKADDPRAVVDSHGKVLGVKSLRVIDSSSLALIPPGHTQGTTYAHAEKLADDIKNGF